MKRILFILTSLYIGILAAQAANIPHLLPWPQKVAWNGKKFQYRGTFVSLTENFCSIGMEQPAGNKITGNPSSHPALSVKWVEDFPDIPLNRNEVYKLRVTSKGVEIEAITETGVYRAIQTLRQLTEKKGNGIAITGCEITDWPAFRIRGFMQDVGRTYISTDELKREIAILARYKINVFHWHLTENQAWRLQSKVFPMLNDSVNTTRQPGKYYTLEEARELAAFCKQHRVLLIPEIDMPGHSAAFVRTFRHDMQSPEGMKILKLLIDEVCETFDVPYLHIGTDEVQFTNPDFVPEMVAYVRSKGKKVISWNPGWHYKPGEIDMTHLWSYRGKAQKGIPAIDEHHHQLEVHIEHIEHEAVCGDSLRIQQVFVNLMSNAVKYTPDGGNITFTIKEKPNGFSELGCYEFSIEDNGIGMTPEFQKIMFEPFSRADDHRTTKVQGTGLGMAIARNIVNLMNGDIQVESAPNKGTKITVTVYLKLQENEKEQEKELLDLPVLVVDDDKTCCESTVATLREIGIAGEWVLTGKEAVERCYARHETNRDYFAVILDWKMPKMDGIATARKIRERVGEDVTIIILTSFDFSEIEEEAKAAGVDAFIAKPLFRSNSAAVYIREEGGKRPELSGRLCEGKLCG